MAVIQGKYEDSTVHVIFAFINLNQRKLYAPQYNGKLKVKACAQFERKNMLDI